MSQKARKNGSIRQQPAASSGVHRPEPGNGINPTLIKLLILAVVFYVIGVCFIQADLFSRIGHIEHAMMHVQGGTVHAE
jgi:hypothetical protein